MEIPPQWKYRSILLLTPLMQIGTKIAEKQNHHKGDPLMEMFTCQKCEGHGKIGAYSHVMAGVCFKCNGTGKVSQKPSAKSQKWVCIYAGQELFFKKAKTEAQALKIAIAHWNMNKNAPAFAEVKSEVDISVRLV
jgi:RecJ-like exonuclease